MWCYLSLLIAVAIRGLHLIHGLLILDSRIFTVTLSLVHSSLPWSTRKYRLVIGVALDGCPLIPSLAR